MFQRLKGAIDSRIAEEQARQRAAALATSPPTSARRSTSRNLSPGKRATRQKERRDGSSEKGPDPSEFEADFVVGDVDSAIPSRAATPRPPELAEKPNNGVDTEVGNGEDAVVEAPESKGSAEDGYAAIAQRDDDLPTEVRVKLRKYNLLEGRYQDLLRAYRTAHARVQLIEPFEASLRENTPLTSINDPKALLEYHNQINLKGDLVLDELKRVSADRDEYKKKFEQSEKMSSDLRQELAALREERQASTITNGLNKEPDQRPSVELSTTVPKTEEPKPEGPSSIKSQPPSTSSRVPSFSIFPPRTKAVKSPPPQETTEEFFSYDNELPQMESELQERQIEIESLKKQVDTLAIDLAVARGSTETMVQTLEDSTHKLQTLQDAKDKFQQQKNDLESELDALQAKSESNDDGKSEMKEKIANLQKEVDQRQETINVTNQQLLTCHKGKKELEEQLAELQEEVAGLREQMSMKDATVKDLEDSLAAYKSAQQQEEKTKEREQSNEKQILILENIMKTLRNQMKDTEGTVASLKQELQEKEREFEQRPSQRLFSFIDDEYTAAELNQIHTKEDAGRYLSYRFPTQNDEGDVQSSAPPPQSEAGGGGPGKKKKNKKKKKAKGGQAASSEPSLHEAPVKVSEDLAEAIDDKSKVETEVGTQIKDLQSEISRLRAQLNEKGTTIDSLNTQLRDQQWLREEIETLRDDLLHQGEEHIEARDALKVAQSDKSALQEEVEKLENELVDMIAETASGLAGSETARDDLRSELEALRVKSATLESDLAVAQQLASSQDEQLAELDEVKDECSQLQTSLNSAEQLAAIRSEQLADFEDVKVKFIPLQKDLAAAEQLAASRFKDITDLRDVLSKMQPELRNLKNELESLRSAKQDLKTKTDELRTLECQHEDLQFEVTRLHKTNTEQTSEISHLNKKISQETSARERAEDKLRAAESDLRYSEARKQEAIETSNQTSKDLSTSNQEITTLRSRVHALEDQVSSHARGVGQLKEEIALKTSLHESSQNYAQSLHDQTHELGTQAREASTRAESLEEELAEAQRMLFERSREGETMRRLLHDAESKTEARLREMKERLDNAIEERDRAEDEASTNGRRLAREMEDLKVNARDAAKALRGVEEEKEGLEHASREWKRRREVLESQEEKYVKEVEEVKAAMAQLRDALDESERQFRELEASRAGLRKTNDEATARIEKLLKANKSLTEEVKVLQQNTRKGSIRPGLDSGVHSSRSSVDSPSTPLGLGNRHHSTTLGSPAPGRPPSNRSETPTGTGLSAGTVDYVYLKNVLFQFLEQRDKGLQKQLVPVLGMLLHFDRKDEQKWMAAITAR